MLLINFILYANKGLQRVPNIQVHPPGLQMILTIQKSKVIQNENRATHNPELLKMKQKIEEAEADEQLKQARKNVHK